MCEYCNNGHCILFQGTEEDVILEVSDTGECLRDEDNECDLYKEE